VKEKTALAAPAPAGSGIGKTDMKPYNLQGDPTLQRYAHVLDASDDYRVLRRLPRPEELWLMPTPAAGGDIVICVIDTETTGLHDDAKIIEVAMLKMTLVDGQLADITEPMSMLEDPGEPLSPVIQSITGITDAELRGQRFDEAALAHAMGEVDVLCAFNAAFDAKHLTRRFPGMCHPWIDARTEFDWQAAGYGGRSQQALLTDFGHFYEAHRAASDIWALAMLIAMPAADGRTIAAHLVDSGRRIDSRIAAVGAPFAVKDQLKVRGYRWQAQNRVWTIDVRAPQVECERAELAAISSAIAPRITEVDWFNRHLR
jgi:DNA polymerase-3 subunit epsilon